ncbi:F-box only protein 27-like isoform X1 [Ranitomeya imitator]|uniref:F-box only protein 27-like isoform X1 n=1 Tax=Ranitomeya imitator TaxID=111125 RepID=UPI0037E75357
MGQGGSQELPPDQATSAREEPPAKLTSYQGGKSTSSAYSAVQRPQHVAFFMDLEPFPEEILLLILSFVRARDLVLRCRLVSRRWRRLVDSPSMWRIKCERDHRRELLLAAEMCPDISWPRVYLKTPFSRNLLRNPFGAEQLKYWDVTNGGDGWKVEANCSELEGAERPTCFVSSFGWCKKSQTIDLLQEGLSEHFLDVHQPSICISDWYAGRHDCGCVYRINVELLAANKNTVLKEFSLAPEPIPQWNDTRYHQVSYEFRHYGPSVRYVKFKHKGKDTKFWKGWYGARITNSSVTVKCHNLEPCT